jgi:hypothetical protein
MLRKKQEERQAMPPQPQFQAGPSMQLPIQQNPQMMQLGLPAQAQPVYQPMQMDHVQQRIQHI